MPKHTKVTVEVIEEMGRRGATKLTLLSMLRFAARHKLPRVDGGACVVMGNGPSLAAEIHDSIDVLRRHPIFAVNLMVSEPVFEELKPTYYVLMDPALSRAVGCEWARSTQVRVLGALQKRVAWPMHVFFPMCPAQVVLEDVFDGTPCELHMVNLFPSFTIPVLRNLVYRTGMVFPPAYNVVVCAIALAINIGYREVYVVGADHSWLSDVAVGDDNRVYLVHRHVSSDSAPLPVYNRPAAPRRPVHLHEWLRDLQRTFSMYHVLADYARYRGVKVYNATPNSFIDAFPRRRLAAP